MSSAQKLDDADSVLALAGRILSGPLDSSALLVPIHAVVSIRPLDNEEEMWCTASQLARTSLRKAVKYQKRV
jgi:hypothetical protein